MQTALLNAAGTEAPSIYGLSRYKRGAFGLLGLKPDEITIRWPSPATYPSRLGDQKWRLG